MRPRGFRAAPERTSGNFVPRKRARRQSFSITNGRGNEAQALDAFFRSTSKRQSKSGAAQAFRTARPANFLRGLGNQAKCPEIVGQVAVGQIGIGNREVALHPPPDAPGIPDDKPVMRVIVANGESSVTAHLLFAGVRRRYVAGLG